MNNKNYNAVITVEKPAAEVFNCINSVTKWWVENLVGETRKPDGVFTIDWGGGNFVRFKIVDFVPGKKVLWLVTDSNLNWLNDKQEWTNTKMDFEIITLDNKTQVDFTHIGLVPGIECYDMCVKGWDQYIEGSLFKLITTGKGEPQLKK